MSPSRQVRRVAHHALVDPPTWLVLTGLLVAVAALANGDSSHTLSTLAFLAIPVLSYGLMRSLNVRVETVITYPGRDEADAREAERRAAERAEERAERSAERQWMTDLIDAQEGRPPRRERVERLLREDWRDPGR